MLFRVAEVQNLSRDQMRMLERHFPKPEEKVVTPKVIFVDSFHCNHTYIAAGGKKNK